MKRILALLLAVMTACSAFAAVSAADEKINATFLYVATDGSDAANGSADAPFATLQKAVEAARAIDGTVVINMHGGTYQMTDTINLTKEDSNLVIRSMNGEEVTITGGTVLPYSAFKKTDDEAFLSALTDSKAKDKIVSANIKDLGVTDLGSIKINGFIDSGAENYGYAPTLTYGEKALTIARYPNDKYLYTDKIIRDGSDDKPFFNSLVQVEFTTADKRYKKWANKDTWIVAYFVHDWADCTAPAEFNAESDTIYGYTNKRYYAKPDRRFYFFNVPEEVDAPGEWYLDRDTGVLYLYPVDGMKADDTLIYNSYSKNFIDISGAENVSFENLKFSGTCAKAINAKDSDKVVVNNCEFTGIGDKVVSFEACMNSGVENSYIHDIGSLGVYMHNCGDKKNLVSGNCFVKNTEIATFSQYSKTYSPAIQVLDDVGTTIANNKLHDAPHFAIRFEENDSVIEYNDIYDVCQDTADTGAIYTGRRWETWGTEVRYNYFHDLEMIDTTTGMEMQAVYLDDMSSATNVHGNVFYKVDSVALIGGGRNNKFCNNIMIDCKKPLVFDARAYRRPDFFKMDSNKAELLKYPYKEGIWAEKYPELVNILDDEPDIPKYNTLTNNVYYNTPEFDLDELVVKNGTVENNIKITSTSNFVDYRNKNFALKEDSEVFTQLPDFENIPFDKIGLQEYTYVDKYVENGTAPAPAPSDDTIKVIVNDKPVEFDVAPTIINDRTMVPLRAIFEALGADVDWDDATKTITAVKDDTTIKMQIGNDKMTKNGTESTLDSAPVIIDSRTLVPVRAIAESFGSDVSWEAETKTVIVKDLPKEEVKDEEKDATEEEVKADGEKTADDKTEEATDEKATDETADDKTADETTDKTETKPEK